MTLHDVIIAGGGPAGSALAIELAGEGYSVLLMDAARFPRDKPCGDYVSPKGLARLDALGCGPAIRQLACTPILRSHLYLNHDRLVSGTMPRVPGLPPHGHAIPRRELDNILFQRALAAGAEGREDCRVKGFEVTPRGVEVIATLEGKPHRAVGRMLVGADGATSAVAHTAGLRMNDPRFTLASLRAYAHGPTVDHTLMYFDEKYFPGYGWVFPVRPGLCNIGVGMVTEPLVRHGMRLLDFYTQFQRVVHDLGRSQGVETRIEPHRGYPIRSYGGARKNYFERGLLIGEAGCFVDPINGEGIPLAMESARIAARTIRAAFRSGRFGEGDLARYETDWRASFEADLGVSDLAVSMIRNRHLLPLWLTLLRTMALTASSDERYARVAGGILGGVVPAREGATAEIFIRSIAHRPAFWRQVLRFDTPGSWSDWLTGGADLVRWQSALGRAMLDDGPWLRDWWREVEDKQRRVGLRILRGY
jgi:menaquinone-9 beta-reductase